MKGVALGSEGGKSKRRKNATFFFGKGMKRRGTLGGVGGGGRVQLGHDTAEVSVEHFPGGGKSCPLSSLLNQPFVGLLEVPLQDELGLLQHSQLPSQGHILELEDPGIELLGRRMEEQGDPKCRCRAGAKGKEG
jgi:hypothetical protein